MRHQASMAMQARLSELRDLLDRLERIKFGDKEGQTLVRKTRDEIKGLEDALVGDDPLTLASIDHLRERYGPMALMEEEGGPRLRLGGSEHWVLVDVAIRDDYGALDFWKCHAIWRETGALYRVIGGNEVVEDPFFVPPGSTYKGPVEGIPTGRGSRYE